MKIAILGTAWPYRGGIADFNNRLAQEFISEGHEVIIYTFTLQYPSFLFPGKTQYSPDPKPDGLNITRSLSSVNPFSWGRTARMLHKEKPDLLIVPFWMPLWDHLPDMWHADCANREQSASPYSITLFRMSTNRATGFCPVTS